jgi:hypothetical protein
MQKKYEFKLVNGNRSINAIANELHKKVASLLDLPRTP